MYERHNEPLISRNQFLLRQGKHFLIVLAIIFGSLMLGMLGYHFFENMAWIDAFLNTAMILGGMGPVDQLHTSAGKIFAGIYALYSGIVFLVVAGVLFAPGFHRILQHFHMDADEKDK
jgi:hypothetical protein